MISTQVVELEESSQKEAAAQLKRLHELEAALKKPSAALDAPLDDAVKKKSYEAPNLENNKVRVPREAGESMHDYMVRKFVVMQDDRTAFEAAKAAELASMKGEIASLHHPAYDAQEEKVNAMKAKYGLAAAKAKRAYDRVVVDGDVRYNRRRTETPTKEEPGAEETKDAAPEMSPEPEPLKDHNDNEETKDEAKAKVKKPPAEEGYVLARVKKIEGLE